MTAHPDSLVKKLLLSFRAILNGMLAFIIFGITLFIPAGTIKFPNAWLFLGIFIICYVTILIYFSFTDPRYAQTRYRATESETAQIVLGSWFALFPALWIPFLLSIRIRNEEKVLRKGLRGYEEYTKKVRYRLIPFIW